MSRSPLLIDERSEPGLRAVIGGLMASAERADFAVTRIRLAAIDLTEREVAMPSCRVLLGTLDATMLQETSDAAGARREQIHRLLSWIRSARLHLRSAGMGSWAPDFSVFQDGPTATCLVGAHYFGNPYHIIGPSLTCVVRDPAAVRVAAERFDALWDRSHDVLPAIRDVLERAL